MVVCLGVNSDGRRSTLGTSTALSEAEVHWRGFLESLVQKGLHGMKSITSDAQAGLKCALKAVFPSVL